MTSPRDRQHTRDRDGAVRNLAVWRAAKSRRAICAYAGIDEPAAWMRGQREIFKGVL